MKFNETKLNKNIIKAVEELGYDDMTKIQEATIGKILDRKNIVAMSSTGSGKTAAFMLPLISNIDVRNRNTEVLVVTPTRELATQIVLETRKYCKYLHGINSIAILGGQDYRMQAISLRKGVKIVVGTPGRLLDVIKKKMLKTANIKALVLDEADEMLSMGFYEEVNAIFEQINKYSQKLLFSATIDNRVRDIAQKRIKNAEYIECKDNATMLVDNIDQYAIDVKVKMKDECVLRILKKENATNSIVFCNTKKKTEELYKFLKENGVKLEMLNSDFSQEEREAILKKLKAGKLDTIVVTDVLARGIDVEDMNLVINYDIPYENEYYVHRIGRTARNGKSGVAYTLYTGKQIDRIRQLEEYTMTKMEYIDVPKSKEAQENFSNLEFPLSKRGLYVVTLSLGKKDQIKAKDIVGALGALAGIKSENIGIIEVKEDISTIEISKDYLADVVNAFESGKIKNKDVKIIKD